MCDTCPLSKKEELEIWKLELEKIPKLRKDLDRYENGVISMIKYLESL